MVEHVYIEYAMTMREAQHFEYALQVIALQELDVPEALSFEERQARADAFFSRPIGWIQQRLEMSLELAAEVNALRQARNELAHGYLMRFTWAMRDEDDNAGNNLVERLPKQIREQLRRDARVIAEEHRAEQEAAVDELRALRHRFRGCNAVLCKRWLAPLPSYETWEDFEEALRADGWEWSGEQPRS